MPKKLLITAVLVVPMTLFMASTTGNDTCNDRITLQTLSKAGNPSKSCSLWFLPAILAVGIGSLTSAGYISAKLR